MNRTWRLAGALCLAHVVLLLAGYSQLRAPNYGDSPESIVATLAKIDESTMYRGLFMVAVAWLVLLAALTFVGRLVRGGGEGSQGWGALTATAATTATAVTLAGGFATAGGATYAAAHGYSAPVVAGITMVTKYADLFAMSAAGLAALAVGIAILAGRAMPAWFGWLSVVVGVVGIAAGSGPDLLDTGNLLWLVWLVVLGIVLLRGPSRRTTQAEAAKADVAAGLS